MYLYVFVFVFASVLHLWSGGIVFIMLTNRGSWAKPVCLRWTIFGVAPVTIIITVSTTPSAWWGSWSWSWSWLTIIIMICIIMVRTTPAQSALPLPDPLFCTKLFDRRVSMIQMIQLSQTQSWFNEISPPPIPDFSSQGALPDSCKPVATSVRLFAQTCITIHNICPFCQNAITPASSASMFFI